MMKIFKSVFIWIFKGVIYSIAGIGAAVVLVFAGFIYIVAVVLESADFGFQHFKWKYYGKHELTEAEKLYNDKIEKICSVLDQQYRDDVCVMTYSEVVQFLNIWFDTLDFSDNDRKRAMLEIDGQNARNSPPEYEFALGGRAECFLLQTFLRLAKYKPDSEPISIWY